MESSLKEGKTLSSSTRAWSIYFRLSSNVCFRLMCFQCELEQKPSNRLFWNFWVSDDWWLTKSQYRKFRSNRLQSWIIRKIMKKWTNGKKKIERKRSRKFRSRIGQWNTQILLRLKPVNDSRRHKKLSSEAQRLLTFANKDYPALLTKIIIWCDKSLSENIKVWNEISSRSSYTFQQWILFTIKLQTICFIRCRNLLSINSSIFCSNWRSQRVNDEIPRASEKSQTLSVVQFVLAEAVNIFDARFNWELSEGAEVNVNYANVMGLFCREFSSQT